MMQDTVEHEGLPPANADVVAWLMEELAIRLAKEEDADISVTIQVEASRFREWLFIPFCLFLGEQHPLVARIWDALKPLRFKVEEQSWKTVRWDEFLRWTEEEGE